MGERWIALEEAAARDPAVVGAKAAGLARADAAGLPVLPGVVVPPERSAEAVRAGSAALRGGGPASAYLAATAAGTAAAAAAAGPGAGPWVVRSSTALDDDGRWAGAFASYLDVAADDLPAAVRGCWASVFSRDVLARCAETRTDVEGLRVGVLVQPFVRFDAGGTARVGPGGAVAVTAAAAGPAGVVAGGRAEEALVDADGSVSGNVPAGVDARVIVAAAALARASAAGAGAGAIEWGASSGAVHLLQVGPSPRPVAPPAARLVAASIPPGAERIARIVAAFPGPVGEELVLPWALGCREVPAPTRVRVDDPHACVREARALAGPLAAAVWGVGEPIAFERTTAVTSLLRGGRVEEGVRATDRLAEPGPVAAGRILGLLAALGDTLVERGRLPAAPLAWRLSVRELERAIDGERTTPRRGPDRWEPFVAEVVLARGAHVAGRTAAPGVGAGPARVVETPGAACRPAPRSVLVAPRPLPQLAPLLWDSAGLVTAGGSAGAHLFEVARSLGVPAVSAVGPTGLPKDGTLLAVDGEAGRVAVLAPPLRGAAVDPGFVGGSG